MFRKIAATLLFFGYFLVITVTLAYGAKTVFTDGNPSLGIKGTRVYASFLNALNNHYHDGINDDGHGALPYSSASGTNTYTLTLSPALTSYVSGMPIYFSVANGNTGASTMNINGLGPISIKKDVSQALVSGDMPSGKQLTIQYDGVYFQLLNPQNISGNAGSASKITDGTNLIHTKIINIGDWNMDYANGVNVAHGLTLSKIRSILVWILPDDSSGLYPLDFAFGSDGNIVSGWFYIGATYISLSRTAGTQFDSASFSATSFNRGYIIITYVD